MNIQENVSLKGKTTMRIGGGAKYYAELLSKEDVEEAVQFASEKNVPLIILGGGSNTLFADDTINALVVRIKNDDMNIDGNTVTAHSGKILAMLINELAEEGLDLSPLTGIPGSLGGAIFGNAGQGPQGIWLDSFVESVEAFDGEWKTLSKDDCNFRYRESGFKDSSNPPMIWKAVLNVPSNDPEEIKAEVERLLQRRIETQPHVKTAGSCFKAVGDTPAWKLIDAAGLRGTMIGDVEISEKHANFLLNTGEASYEDVVATVKKVKTTIDSPLEVEMRFIEPDGENREWT